MKNIYLILFSLLIMSSCGGGGGGGSDSPPPVVATASLIASDTDIFPGETTFLNWTSTDATSCTASGSWSGSLGTSGSQAVTVAAGNNTYNIRCGNSTTASVTVVGIVGPTVSIETIETINALEEITFTASIEDPQNRFISSSWAGTSTSGENFTYNYNNTSITFIPPQQCDFQTVTPFLTITYDTSNNNNGDESFVETSTTSTIVPAIPDAPQNFSGVAGSQSADFTWDEAVGSCSYSYYYSYDTGGLTKESPKVDTSAMGEGSLVSIVNDRDIFLAVSATNVSGESDLSNEIKVTATGPSNEYTGQPNNQNPNLSELDYWGNIIGDYSGSLSAEASCVKDNVTGMIWSIEKPTDTGSLHYTYGTYTYYDETNVVDDINDFGTKNQNGTSCSFSDDSNSSLNCNTQDYLIHINSGKDQGQAFCGVENWRIPSQDEALQHFNLVDDGDFENDEKIWTSSSMAQEAPANQIVSKINWGGSPYIVFEEDSKSTLLNIRAVSSVDEIANDDLDFTIECVDWEEAIEQNSSDHNKYYSLEDAIDRASLISNQTGIDWVVPTLYELAHFKEKIKQSPGPTYRVISAGGGVFSTHTAEYEVITTTPTIGTANDTPFRIIRNVNGLLDIDDSFGEGAYQMCFKGPAGASIN